MRLHLKSHPSFKGVEGPVLIVVMDGVGRGRKDEGDAVHLAQTPTLDWLETHATTFELAAHGIAVGLPSDEDMGNSEVGHNALGAGRVFDQGAKRVQLAMLSGELFQAEGWKTLVEGVKKSDGTFHLLGLLSDGNVHSHQDHCHAMVSRLREEGVRKVRVHVLLDGRDVEQRSALGYLEALEKVLAEARSGGNEYDYQIASGGGRMTTTMDRYEADWSMVERGWDAHVRGVAERHFRTASNAVSTFYGEDHVDQFMPAFVIVDEDDQPVGTIRDGDSVVLFNFRGDRAIEICRAFEEETLSTFVRQDRPEILFAGMMEYDGDLHIPRRYLVEPPTIDRTAGEYLAAMGVRQFACSETQKFGHVTYFWNGNRSGKFDESTEHYVEIKSDNIPFEQRPWMKAAEITDATLEALDHQQALRINFANGDMVGHTGHLQASILAVECVDLQLERILAKINEVGGVLIVTADHGNADQMFECDKNGVYKVDKDGTFAKRTSHSLNPVPCYIWAPGYVMKKSSAEDVGLANIAATLLHLLGYAAPEGYHPSLVTNIQVGQVSKVQRKTPS